MPGYAGRLARREDLSACNHALRLDRPADGPPDQGFGGLVKQARQRHAEGFRDRYNSSERRIQGRIFELLEVLEIDSHGIGRLLLRPPAGSSQAREIRGKVPLGVLEGRPRSHTHP